MNILTPYGYKLIADIQVGDKVVAFDMVTGEKIENEVLEKTLWTECLETPFFNGNFYLINGEWKCYSEQSIWRNDNQVVHIKDLVVGDIVFDGEDKDVTITSIEPLTETEWYRFEISGDHSYIQDNLTLHNASRFWVGGTGTWDNSTTTNWSGTSGGAGGSSVPGSADTATFDASSGGGTVTPDYDMTVTSITMGAFTGTLAFNTNNVSPTMSTFSGTGTGTRTLSMGSGTWTVTGNNTFVWTTATATNLTLNRNTATVNFTYSGSVGSRVITGVPGSAGDIMPSINITAGSDTVTFSSGNYFKNIDFTGFTGTYGTNTGITCFGGFTLGTGMTVTGSTGVMTFAATSGTNVIRSNSVVFDRPITFNGVGGTWQLFDNLDISTTARTITLTNGTFDANNKNVTMGLFSSSNSNVRTLTMGSGTWTLTGTGTVWTTATSTNLTLIPGSSTVVISESSTTSKTFSGGGLTYANLTASGDNVIIVGDNTFNQVNNNTAGLTNGLIFTAGSSTTLLGALGLTTNGSTNSLARLTSSSAGTPATLSKASGTVQVSFMYTKDSTATGGATFNAYGSLNISGNTGWNFPSGGFRTDNTATRLKTSTARLKVSTPRLVATVDRLESPFN